MIEVPATVELAIDSNEQQPFEFPTYLDWSPLPGWPTRRLKIAQVTRRLSAGDYLLTAFAQAAIIERKKNLIEVFKNLLTKDAIRQHKAFQRLATACTTPYLLIEGTPMEAIRQLTRLKLGDGSKITGHGTTLDRFFGATAQYGFRLIWAGNTANITSRRLVGEMVLRILLQHAIHDRKDKWTEQSSTKSETASKSKKSGNSTSKAKPTKAQPKTSSPTSKMRRSTAASPRSKPRTSTSRSTTKRSGRR